MVAVTACPSVHTLEQLFLGQLTVPETESLARHLEQCGACVATVRGLKVDDTLVEMIRRPGPAAADANAP